MTQGTNPLGAVCIFDGENPRTFTAKAREVISGGNFVYISGAATTTGVVGSQASSFTVDDLKACKCNTFGRCNGIALNNAGSDEYVTIATRGAYLVKSAGAVSGGGLVGLASGTASTVGNDAVVPIGYGVDTGSVIAAYIGRAITEAGSESYCLVSLNL